MSEPGVHQVAGLTCSQLPDEFVTADQLTFAPLALICTVCDGGFDVLVVWWANDRVAGESCSDAGAVTVSATGMLPTVVVPDRMFTRPV